MPRQIYHRLMLDGNDLDAAGGAELFMDRIAPNSHVQVKHNDQFAIMRKS